MVSSRTSVSASGFGVGLGVGVRHWFGVGIGVRVRHRVWIWRFRARCQDMARRQGELSGSDSVFGVGLCVKVRIGVVVRRHG